jgi:MFS transporter, NNP family, nitrate/nitrite transporter
VALAKNDAGSAPAGKDSRDSGEQFWPHVGPVLFLAVLFFLNFTSRTLLAPLLPAIEKDLGVSHGQAGFFFFLISVGYFVALLGCGFFSPRIMHRSAIIVSCGSIGIALLSVSLMQSIWGIRAGMLGLGLAAGIYIPSAIAAITSLIDSRHWGKAIAIHELAPNVSFVAAPLLAEIFLEWFSWRVALGSLGGAALIAAMAFGRYGRGGEFRGESPAASSVKALIRSPSFWLMVFLFGLGVASTLGAFAMLPLYLITEKGMNRSWANTLIALSRVAGPFTGFAAGWISDKLGPKPTMFGALFLTGITTLLLGAAPGSWIVVFVLLQPALSVCFFPAGFAALSAIAPASSRNVAVSFTIPLGFLLGAGATPTFIGVMGDAGSFALGFTLLGGLILSGAALALCLKLPAGR